MVSLPQNILTYFSYPSDDEVVQCLTEDMK